VLKLVKPQSKKALRAQRDAYLCAATEAFSAAQTAAGALEQIQDSALELEAEYIGAMDAWSQVQEWAIEIQTEHNVAIAQRDAIEANYLAEGQRYAALLVERDELLRALTWRTKERDQLAEAVAEYQYRMLGINLLHEQDDKGRCKRCNQKAPCKTMQMVMTEETA
jgi:hypothetical protein